MSVLTGLRIRLPRLALVSALSFSAVTLAAAPSGAVSCLNADGRIKAPTEGTVGNGILNSTAVNQTVFEVLEPGQITNVIVRYRNTSGKTRGITIGPEIDNFENFRVRAFVGAEDVSSPFLGSGSVKFSGVPAGHSTPKLRIEVKMRNNAGMNELLDMDVSGRFGDSQVCGDMVSLVAGAVN